MRRKKVKPSTATSNQRPHAQIVELSSENISEASLPFLFARTYTPEMLAKQYSNGFKDCLVTRVDEAIYAAKNGEAASLLDLPAFIKLYKEGEIQPELHYNGYVPDDVIELALLARFANMLEEKEPDVASAIKSAYKTIGENVSSDAYRTHLMYAASFGMFSEHVTSMIRKSHALTYGQLSYACIIADIIGDDRLEYDERAQEVKSDLNTAHDVCVIWTEAFKATKERGDIRSIARDAIDIMNGNDKLLDTTLGHWRSAVDGGEHAEKVMRQVIAIGMTCGADVMIDAYMSGTPLTYILED